MVIEGMLLLTTLLLSLRCLPGEFIILYKNCIKARDRILHRFYYIRYDESHALRKDAGGLIAVLLQMQEEYYHQAGYEIVSDLRGLSLVVFFAGLDTTLCSTS